jgi:large subunit ribosomal protein L31
LRQEIDGVRSQYAIIEGFPRKVHPAHRRLASRPEFIRSALLADVALASTLQEKTMAKEGIHPNYREVLFVDLSNGFKFVTRSCANTKETGKTDDGRELPLFKLDTSSESHPFYTGTQKSVDNMGGRVERFRNKFGKTALSK